MPWFITETPSIAFKFVVEFENRRKVIVNNPIVMVEDVGVLSEIDKDIAEMEKNRPNGVKTFQEYIQRELNRSQIHVYMQLFLQSQLKNLGLQGLTTNKPDTFAYILFNNGQPTENWDPPVENRQLKNEVCFTVIVRETQLDV